MERHELQELHYITPVANVASIMQHGILSHVLAERLPHSSVAMQEIQDLRASRSVPGGKPLHEYVNLYICARNPMLYRCRGKPVCVLAVSADVLDLEGVVVTDANAASSYMNRFARAPDGLAIVDRELTFAEFWTLPGQDPIDYWRRKAAKCAEVLVPDRIEPRFICGAYAPSEATTASIEALNTGVPVRIDSHLFFR